tara:strand:+ start:2429 stop:2695 length:267 start_codon:yes stop_codon:yes gene_type:complete
MKTILQTIYNVIDYNEFPNEVTKAFGELDNGFEIESALNKIGYEVLDMNLDGGFTNFVYSNKLVRSNIINRINDEMSIGWDDFEIFKK